jgi:hypothetical protein
MGRNPRADVTQGILPGTMADAGTSGGSIDTGDSHPESKEKTKKAPASHEQI